MARCPHPKAYKYDTRRQPYSVGYMLVTLWACDDCGESWETSKYVDPEKDREDRANAVN